MPYRILPARPEHISGICRAHGEAVRGLAREHYTPEQLAAWAGAMRPASIERALGEPDKTLLVAFSGADTPENVVGFVLFGPGEIWAMYVCPEHARQGLGTRFLARAEDAARRRGCPGLRLTASRNAVGFYLANGFEAVEETVFTFAGGIGLPCLRMGKSLLPED